MESFEDVVRRMPMTWECCRCGKSFPNRPDSPMPHAFEVVVNKKTGLRERGGEICKPCYDSPTKEPSNA
jgi:hypothetical protein